MMVLNDFGKFFLFCEVVIYMLFDVRGWDVFRCCVVYFIEVVLLVVEIFSLYNVVVVLVYLIKFVIFLEKGLIEDEERCVMLN